MARPINVLSINFPFKSTAVVQEPRISTGRALFDFDVDLTPTEANPAVTWPIQYEQLLSLREWRPGES
jgi:hypothetical protein